MTYVNFLKKYIESHYFVLNILGALTGYTISAIKNNTLSPLGILFCLVVVFILIFMCVSIAFVILRIARKV